MRVMRDDCGVFFGNASTRWSAFGTSVAKSGAMTAASETLNFGYNNRSELTSAVSDVDANYNYAYAFDNIGNRTSSTEAGTQSSYSANALNQYDSISLGEAVSSPLQYDADGNATLIQTSTGTWAITSNGANRPIRFENAETQTVVECVYDSQGRRFEKKVTVAGTMTLRERKTFGSAKRNTVFSVSDGKKSLADLRDFSRMKALILFDFNPHFL